jgi:hypothetical protein
MSSDVQLDRIEARLRTLTILQQRMRLQLDRLGDEITRLLTAMQSQHVK